MVSVIIVNWNTQKLLQECLQVVADRIPDNLLTEVIVVDNGSTDGSPDLVRRDFPHVKLIVNSDNLGFAAANNKAIEKANGKYIVFLNTDTTLINGAVERMVEFMNNHPQAGLCTPTLLREDGSIQNTFGSYPSLKTELFKSHVNMKTTVVGARQVSTVRGACMLARRGMINNVAGFDERYFLFLEETDLCYRLNKEGYGVWWLPEARVYHLGGGSAEGQSGAARIEYWRSRYLFFSSHYPVWQCRLLRLGLGLRLVVDWLLNLIATLVTLFVYQPFLNKLKRYTVLLCWHFAGYPGTWGLDSRNIIKDNGWEIKKAFYSWWQENKSNIIEEKGNIEVVKNNAVRKVFIYQDEFYVKKYKRNVFWLIPPWLNEWRISSRLRQLGIATAIPVAVGPHYLITQKIHKAMSLHDYILKNDKQLPAQKKIKLCRELAGFVGLLHRKGLYHGDLHAGNVLLSIADDKNEFFIMDLHRAKLKINLSEREVINNLVQFNMFFSLRNSHSLRLLFFKEYIAGTSFVRRWRRLACIIEQRTKDACQKLWSKRDKLYFKKEKYGVWKEQGKIRYIINPGYKQLAWDDVFRDSGVVIKDSRSSYVTKCMLPAIGEVVIKISRQKQFVNCLKDIFRYPRAFKSYSAGWALLNRGIATPKPLAAGEERKWGLVKKSVFIAEYIPEALNIALWVRQTWFQLSLSDKKNILTQLARYIRVIHDRGIFPFDLKGSNILVEKSAVRTSFYLIDLDHVATKKHIYFGSRIYNVKQVLKSFPDKRLGTEELDYCFLRNYFYAAPEDKIKEYRRLLYK